MIVINTILSKYPPENSVDYSNGLLKSFKDDSYLLKNLKMYSSRIDNGNETSFLYWGVRSQFYSQDQAVFFSLSFQNLGIGLTNYSLYIGGDLCYSESYSLMGVNNEKTVILDTRNISKDCQPTNSIYKHCGKNISYIFKINQTDEIFTKFIFISDRGSCINGNHFSFIGIELFGILYRIGTLFTCNENILFKNNNFLRFILIILTIE